MLNIGQCVVCIDDKFVGENRVFDPTFAVRCPNLPVKGGIYTVRDFVRPYGHPGPAGILLQEIRDSPSQYVEGAFEPSFCQSRFRPFVQRKTDISAFERMLNCARLEEPV